MQTRKPDVFVVSGATSPDTDGEQKDAPGQLEVYRPVAAQGAFSGSILGTSNESKSSLERPGAAMPQANFASCHGAQALFGTLGM